MGNWEVMTRDGNITFRFNIRTVLFNLKRNSRTTWWLILGKRNVPIKGWTGWIYDFNSDL